MLSRFSSLFWEAVKIIENLMAGPLRLYPLFDRQQNLTFTLEYEYEYFDILSKVKRQKKIRAL